MQNKMTRGELRVIADTDHVQCGDAAAMANMLLELLDSQPVAWWTGPEPTPTGEDESVHDHETGSHTIPLLPAYLLAAHFTQQQIAQQNIPEKILEGR
jgi:hypothetical protein